MKNKKIIIWLVIVALIGGIIFVLYSGEGEPEESQPEESSETETTVAISEEARQGVESYVNEALPLLETEGIFEMALEDDDVEKLTTFTAIAFQNAPTYETAQVAVAEKQTYIFVLDKSTDTILFNGGFPERSGTSLLNDTDEYAQERIDALYSATEEGVWITYRFRNPESEGEELEHKESFVISRGDIIVGAGLY